MPIRGAYFQQSHEVMEPRRARNAINYTDCPRPLLGSGRNRYVPVASACRGSMINRYARVPAGAAERDKLTWHSYYPAAPFFGLFSQFHYYNRKVISLHRHSANGKVRLLRSCELIRPKLLCPFVEFHKAIFGVGGWDPYSLPRFRIFSAHHINSPGMPVRKPGLMLPPYRCMRRYARLSLC